MGPLGDGREAPRWMRCTIVAFVVLLGAAARLGLLLQWPGRLGADESTVGLMGLHILRGEFPVFFSGQGYMGAPEAYLSAVVYAVVGASPLTAKLAVFACSCLFIVVSALVGWRIAAWPGGALGGLLVALGPPFLPVWGNYPMLGYMEVVVVGALTLLLTLDLVAGRAEGSSRVRKLLILGLLAGLGWWLNPMFLSYLAAAGIFLLFGGRLRPYAGWLALALGFSLGSLPFWLFNFTHAFWTFVLFRRGVEGDLRLGLRNAGRLLLEIVGVRGILADPVPYLSAAAGAVYVLLLGILCVELVRRSPRQHLEARRWRLGLRLLLLFSLGHLVAFAMSGWGAGASNRHLFPLYSTLPVLTAIALLCLWRWSRLLSIAALALLLLNNGLALAKTAGFFETSRRTDWWKPEPLVKFLEAEGLTRAYAEIRIAPRLTFDTQERVVVAYPFAERRSAYLDRADASPRVAYVLSKRGEEITPGQFEPLLRGITQSYERREFGEFVVFYNFRPQSEEGLASIRPEGWRAEASPPGSDPSRAFDRDVDTAWFSEAWIRSGMWFRVDLGKIVPVSGVTILPIRRWFGIPRGYQVELSRDEKAWDVVASVPDFAVTLRWRDGQPRIDRSGQVVSRFAPRPARYLRITQTGENPDQWWAIAELFVHGPQAGVPRERSPAADALREGIRLEQARQWGAALSAYERAVHLDPELDEAHWRTAEVYREAGLPVEGSDLHRRAEVFERLGLWQRAVRQYEMLLDGEAREGGQHSDLLNRLLAVYRRSGERGQEGAERVQRRLREEYAPPSRAEAGFGQVARLLGYGLEPPSPRAGEEVELGYYWQALEPTADDLSVSVHFVHGGKIRFRQDHEPLNGQYPTSRWRKGELIRERYRVALPRDLPPGAYVIRIGLRNARTGKRLPVETSLPHDRHQVQLTTLHVLPPR